MRKEAISIIAPAVTGEPFCEAEALGSCVWLWMHSTSHQDAPLHMLSTLLLPAIKNGQFVLASEHGKPIFYMAWAQLSAEAEKRYLRNPPQCMPREDWTSGNRTWILDWVAPFGHTRAMKRLIAGRIFPGWCARSLYHRGETSGLRVMTFHGMAVTPEEARFWFEQNPLELET